MWKPELNYITLHYAWIIFAGLLALVVLYPYGNISAMDAWFFGASASTESGLNTVDIKDLKTYQQVYTYVIPIITNLGFINIIVITVRLRWFEKRFKAVASSSKLSGRSEDIEVQIQAAEPERPKEQSFNTEPAEQNPTHEKPKADEPTETASSGPQGPRVTFGQDVKEPRVDSTLYIPPPRERDDGTEAYLAWRNRRIADWNRAGHSFVERNHVADDGEDDSTAANMSLPDEDAIKPVVPGGVSRRRGYQHEDEPSMSRSRTVEQAVTSLFVLGKTVTASSRQSAPTLVQPAEMPYLSKQATLGRNSSFHRLTAQDRERLGGIEYRALKLLQKIVTECAQDKTWWAFYLAQTMVNNLGFTLTPDSMITFRDATWVMLVTSFLAYGGETFYPVFMRLIIWIMSKLVPKQSSLKEPLEFLLNHPRRCSMLLFPSRPTWILFGILFAMNFVDVLLIIVSDLDNPAVNVLPMGPRILAALFQAASARHTGTAAFNLAEVNPGVQFTLVVMMYIAIFPIAISIRASNTYEERSLGIYEQEVALDESNGKSYVMMHIRNQLSFDLWYIFLGTFWICFAEAPRIMDNNDPAFSVFSIMFEVVSAYANVGLSLGHPTVSTSLSGKFTTASKVAICAMMIRGRHRGLPYAVDRAVLLPGEPEYRGFAGHDDGPAQRNGGTLPRGRRSASRELSRGE
ncbi:cation transport protein-domain-containing protein [Chaetomium tenue]|uniref:Cation transport protein-domain-containing protein n=1 Tax=Chaetomium tenue TaxID=1854479 RepID=A0ACB7PDQ8_9PEZI|nr:cation transport protein-domain-containing protein [Chaetomium globosum]